MKTSFKVSLAANLGLAVLALWLAQRRPGEAGGPLATGEVQRESPAPTARAAEEPPIPAARFHWRELESTDYRVYIANLRAIECPEQTIRDIIAADVDGLYAPRRGEARQALGGRLDPQLLQTRLQQLQTEEDRVMLALLGPPKVLNGSDPSTSTNAPATERPVRRNRFSSLRSDSEMLPLAWSDPGPEMDLKPGQIELINDIRTTFNDQVQALDSSAGDYRARWLDARREADQRMVALLGYSFWQEYQAHVRNQAPAAAPQ